MSNPLASLPVELLVQILDLLSISTLAALRAASRSFNVVVGGEIDTRCALLLKLKGPLALHNTAFALADNFWQKLTSFQPRCAVGFTLRLARAEPSLAAIVLVPTGPPARKLYFPTTNGLISPVFGVDARQPLASTLTAFDSAAPPTFHVTAALCTLRLRAGISSFVGRHRAVLADMRGGGRACGEVRYRVDMCSCRRTTNAEEHQSSGRSGWCEHRMFVIEEIWIGLVALGF
ncbi:hypothetical protein BDZ88DRAFT_415902 [Geranomyces variabilis]|nr:hypothetical protein BDZ88DRAFT_415902 [Geranomyces variabilis]